MKHGVVSDAADKLLFLFDGREFAIDQQVANFQVVRLLGKLLYGIAAMEQYPRFPIYESDGGFAARGRGVAGVKCKITGLRVKPANVDDIRSHAYDKRG